MPYLEIRDLVVEYKSDGYSVRPIDGLNMTADEGELIVLLGPSGSGKTTLLSCLGGIQTPTSGSITVGNVKVSSLDRKALVDYRRRSVGIAFQAFNLIGSLTAKENVAAPLLMTGAKRAEAFARAQELLARVGLSERSHHRPAQLSGGQQQRVAVARALAHDPPLVLADEPTANLDYIQAESVITLLRELRAPGRLVIVSTHDNRIVPVADRVVSLVEDVEAEAGPPQVVEYSAGEEIFHQGSMGHLVYVIRSGSVDIVRELAEGGREHLNTLPEGHYFGELGALLGFPRSASAIARTDVALLAYGVTDFRTHVLDADGPTDPS